MSYFAKEESMRYRVGSMEYKKIIGIIATKYIADNPPLPFVFRAYNTKSIAPDCFGVYDIDFCKLYPNSNKGDYAYAAVKVYSENGGIKGFSFTCLGKVWLYMNGELAYESTIQDESEQDRKNTVVLDAQKGWNTIFIKCKKLCDNYFGIKFSGNSPKWAPSLFYSPIESAEGACGFVHSNCVRDDCVTEEALNSKSIDELSDKLIWYPEYLWDDEKKSLNPCVRIFGKTENKYALAWSKLICYGEKSIGFSGVSTDKIEIFLDGRCVLCSELGDYSCIIKASAGEHDIIIKGYDYSFNTKATLHAPGNAKGVTGEFLYLGTFDAEYEIENVTEYQTLYKLFNVCGKNTYWHTDAPNTVIRPGLENEGFAKWSYPHGVTLYGLVQTGRLLGRDDIVQYVRSHVEEAAKLYSYTMWDRETYGYPNINQQLSWFSALDDEGSFASLMIEVLGKDKCGDAYEQMCLLADKIADYILNKLEKTEDGAFFRIMGEQRTMWADDLYMSVPFLSRYYELRGDERYLELAAKQFLLFKKYLWIEADRIFSHVYDFRRASKSNVPWGRGNGWVFFSLSELLERMPKDYRLRPHLEELFRELTDGCLKLQGINGLWHQVLNDSTTYEETSATSMIIFALSRGMRMGIIPKDKALNAVIRAWEGLTEIAIERHGNIYGVCRGSGYSFDPEYYRGLQWNYNDTHGIGIVMLAGIEYGKLMRDEVYG